MVSSPLTHDSGRSSRSSCRSKFHGLLLELLARVLRSAYALEQGVQHATFVVDCCRCSPEVRNRCWGGGRLGAEDDLVGEAVKLALKGEHLLLLWTTRCY